MKAQIRSVQPPDTDALSVLAGESFLERIVVIGSSCAGKTTFAKRLGSELGHPVCDLDELFWRAELAGQAAGRVSPPRGAGRAR